MAHVKDVGFAENFLKRDGRLNRWRFFKRNLAVALMAFVPIFLILLFFSDKPGQPSTLGVILIDGFSLVLMVPYYCLTVRRLHDLNKGEKLAQIYAAIYIATILFQGTDFNADSPSIVEGILGVVNVAIFVYVLFFPGTRGENQYGSDPLE